MHCVTGKVFDLSGEPALLEYIAAQETKFHQHAIQNPASRLKDLYVIHLRGPTASSEAYSYGEEHLTCVDKPAYQDWPEVRALVGFILGALDLKQLGNVSVSCMYPGAFIEPHVDPGLYFKHYRRLHVPIVTNPACYCYYVSYPVTGALDKVNMAPGHVWELNNCDHHWFHNTGSTNRMHVVIDAV